MATINIQVAQTGQTTLSKTYNMSDTDMDLMIEAYQQDANISVNGTASRAQVLNFITLEWMDQIKAEIQAHKTVPASVPPPITIS